MVRQQRFTAAVIGAVLALGMLAACGSESNGGGSPSNTSGGSTTIAPEYVLVSDQVVQEGLTSTVALLNTLAAVPQTADDAALKRVTALWNSYEGTIKQNDVGAYLDAEDALALFTEAAQNDVPDDMTSAATKFSAMADAYLAVHPG